VFAAALATALLLANVTAAEVTKPRVYTVTAYTAGPESTGKSVGHPAYGVTASGERVQDGHTAACPRELAYGTVIDIEGVGERVCSDRGGAIKGARIDVYMTRLSDAKEFGKRKLNVTIRSD
jgi:3D (Asp-Asp-Asp) domain-containing protein